MKRSLLIMSTFLSAMTFAQDCSEIFISEYVEGFGNNKALEIYNPTANTIDLSQYFVSRLSNGAGIGAASASNSVQLTGTIAPYGTHVGVIDKTDPNGTGQDSPVWDELQAKADAFYCPDYNTSNAWYFNGNDCLMLAKGTASNPQSSTTVLVDFFGKQGQDPENTTLGTNGWSSVSPFNMTAAEGGNTDDRVVTENHSMLRKPSIKVGKSDITEILSATYQFDPLLEYDSIPASVAKIDQVTGDTVYQSDGVTPQWEGNWSTLGWHPCDCSPTGSVNEVVSAADVAVFPNPSNGAFVVKGIESFESMEVVNSLGQVVKSISNNTKSIVSVNLEDRKGVYFVKLSSSNGNVITKKVIIK